MLSISISSNPVTGKTATLTAIITGLQPVSPVYTWSVLNAPSGGSITFSDNADPTASTTTITFARSGGHLIQLVVADGSNPSQTAVIDVQVNQTAFIVGSPGSFSIALPTHQGLTATVFDQFLQALLVQPPLTWTITAGGGTLYSTSPSTALFIPPGVAGTTVVQVSALGLNRTGQFTISTGAYPTVATPAAASPSPATGRTTGLTVLGATTNSGGEATLTYTWTATVLPSGAAQPLFTANGTHAAQATTAIFQLSGAYTLTCTITDVNGLTVTSSVNVTVNQTAASAVVSPATVVVPASTTQQFTVVVNDQFGVAMASQPSITWSNTGVGSINSSTGLYTAPGSPGSGIVIATTGSVKGTAGVTVTSTGPVLTSLVLYPNSVSLASGATQVLTPAPLDQSGNLYSPAPSYTFTLLSGIGSVSSTGEYTAPPSTNGTAVVQVSGGSLTATATITIVDPFTPGIFFNATTGTLTIQANAYSNNILIQPYTTSSGVQLLLVSLTSTNSSGATVLSQSGQYALSSVTYIYYYGQAGVSTSFQNLTAVACTAYGGSGTNLLVGGSGNDALYAGVASSNNTVKGMDGNDTLIGGTGTNYMYGGTGNNILIPGLGQNYLFPNG